MTVPAIGFVGDDFTGSTDALESLHLGGFDAVLFVDDVPPKQLDSVPDTALGLATTSRTWTPDEMRSRLPARFASVRDAGVGLLHYKVCSTFDSSPHIGSIGTAIDLGIEAMGSQTVPVVVGTPTIGRAVVFGNLFARADGVMYRIDRHPTMSRHPVTPMPEADLRRHLGDQTTRRIGSVDLTSLAAGVDAARAAMDAERTAGSDVIVFDTIDDGHLRTIGRLLLDAADDHPLFVVGSSAVERAISLAAPHRAPNVPAPVVGEVDQVLVMSGSASPVTAAQIEHAGRSGYCVLRVDPDGSDLETLHRDGLEAWRRGHSVVYFSALGPDDQMLLEAQRTDPGGASIRLGHIQAQLVRRLVETVDVPRICVSGGDTCGRVVHELQIRSLRIAAALDPGGPLCIASSENRRVDGLQVALKGGQIGSPDYFENVRRGRHRSAQTNLSMEGNS